MLLNSMLVFRMIARNNLLAVSFHGSSSSTGQRRIPNLFVLQVGLKIKASAASVHHAFESQKVVCSNYL